MSEITFEITNYCRKFCKFCSANATNQRDFATFISFETIYNMINDKHYDRIIISGGEPLYHPDIGAIIDLCNEHANDVVVYSNLITHLAYNSHVIDGVYLDCMITVPDSVDKVKILRRTPQGREGYRPEVTFSNNFDHKCDCSNSIVLPTGEIKKNNCCKNVNKQ